MIYHKGRWLIEPEIKALLTKLEDLNKELRSEADRVLRENAELRAKVESANRQIAEYKRLLKAAVEDFRFLESHSEDEEGNCLINYNGLKIDCKICPLNNAGICDPKIGCRWNHEAESLALIGEEGENNA